MARLLQGEHLHRDNQLGRYTIRLGGVDYLAMIDIKSAVNTTPTIYNVSTTDANWTAIGTGLSNVVSWRLSELNGNDFWFAFTAAPATFMTGFGWVGDNTSISEIYCKRPASADISMQLLVWSI